VVVSVARGVCRVRADLGDEERTMSIKFSSECRNCKRTMRGQVAPYIELQCTICRGKMIVTDESDPDGDPLYPSPHYHGSDGDRVTKEHRR
jgi:hypothetical protein